jgi:hypothetical protein
VVSFGEEEADRNYVEALAWGWVVDRIAAGHHPGLLPKEIAEIATRYRRHFERFRKFVMERQPSAWAHYGRFLRDPAAGQQPGLIASAP